MGSLSPGLHHRNTNGLARNRMVKVRAWRAPNKKAKAWSVTAQSMMATAPSTMGKASTVARSMTEKAPSKKVWTLRSAWALSRTALSGHSVPVLSKRVPISREPSRMVWVLRARNRRAQGSGSLGQALESHTAFDMEPVKARILRVWYVAVHYRRDVRAWPWEPGPAVRAALRTEREL